MVSPLVLPSSTNPRLHIHQPVRGGMMPFGGAADLGDFRRIVTERAFPA